MTPFPGSVITKVNFTHYILDDISGVEPMAANLVDASTQRAGTNHFHTGLLFAIGSACAFGSSGPFAKALMEAGWSPTAAVTARLAGGALLMAIFATIVRPDWFREALQHAKTVVAYGLIPIAGAQLCYF